MTLRSKIKKAWNAFKDEEEKTTDTRHRKGQYSDTGVGRSDKVQRYRMSYANERSNVTAIYNKISIDVMTANIRHVRVDQNGRFLEEIDSSLNDRLTVSANIDQTGRAFIQDAVLTMFDTGSVAIVPVDTYGDDILSLRTGNITEWFPRHVRVEVYNELKGEREDIVLPKDSIAIIENPMYAVMNRHNSTLKRLTRKLALLDAADEKANSGKLDLIIQLPYSTRNEIRKEQAASRMQSIEEQLTNSPYGIAYIDSTETITQLNRPAENNLMAQIEYLTSMLYGQLGLTEAVFTGEASENEMQNYYSRTVEPILTALTEGMEKTFLKKDRTVKVGDYTVPDNSRRRKGTMEKIHYTIDPFRLIPVSSLADIADKFTRNEILTSNEIRSIIGYRPSDDPAADELRNKNLNTPGEDPEGEPNQNGIENLETEDEKLDEI